MYWSNKSFWITTAILFLLLIMVYCIGCKTVPITPAQHQIETAINTDILKPSSKDNRKTTTEKKVVKSALIAAGTEIELMQAAIDKAEKKAASNAVWAKRGKYSAVGLGFILFLIIIRGIFWILKLFRVIP